MKRKRVYIALLALIVIAGVIITWLRLADQPTEVVLFQDLPTEEIPDHFFDQGIAKRARWVRLDETGLQQLSLTDGQPKEVVLNLFPDLRVKALITDNVTHWNGDQAAYGFIDENPDSMFVMSRHQEVMMGLVVLPDARQVLISFEEDDPEGHKYVIVEIDPQKAGSCGTCVTDVSKLRQPSKGDTQEATNVPDTGKKVSQSSGGAVLALSRQLAKRNDGARKLLEQQPCDVCTPLDSTNQLPVPTQVTEVSADAPLPIPPPMLATVNPRGMLAANRWRIHDTQGGNTRRQPHVGRPTRSGAMSLRPDEVEYIDILFLYTTEIHTALGGNAGNGTQKLQARVDLIIDSLNGIFVSSGVNLAVRQAGNCTLAECRTWGGTGGIGSGGVQGGSIAGAYPPEGPLWTEVQAPERPDYTVVPPVKTFGLGTAWAGFYLPTYGEPNASGTTMAEHLEWLDDRRNSLLYGSQYWGFEFGSINSDMWGFHDSYGGGGGSDNIYPPMENVPKGTVFRMTPNSVSNIGAHIFHNSITPGHKVGPVDRWDSKVTIQGGGAGPAASAQYRGDQSHDTVFFRYDEGGWERPPPWGSVSSDELGNMLPGRWGTTFNIAHNSPIGMRMDYNGTDYAGNSFIGNPNETRWDARYPCLHGQEGPFDPTYDINNNPYRRDVRADVVCLLAGDTVTPAGTSGLSFPYRNIRPVNAPGRTVGRGPYPKANKIDELEFVRHDGEISDVGGRPFDVTFQTLRPVAASNNATASGLLAYYPFNNNANDESGNGKNLSVTGSGVAPGVDQFGVTLKAYDFGGAGNLQSTSNLNFGNHSISVWVKTSMTSQGGIVSTDDSSNNHAQIYIEANGRFTVEVDKGAQVKRYTSANAINDDLWHHVLYSYDADFDVLKLYLDGVEEVATKSSDVAITNFSLTEEFRVGHNSAESNRLSGSVDEVRIYNKALTEDDVRGLYVTERANTTVLADGLILDYPFETGSLLDKSPQGNAAVTGPTGAGPPLVFDRHGFSNGTLELDGADDFLSTQTANGFPTTNGNFTMSLWANVRDIVGPDGAVDIVVTTQGVRDPVIRKNDGTGSFPNAGSGVVTLNNTGGGTTFSAVKTVDIDLDGDKDIIIANASSGTSGPTRLFRNNGDNTFAAAVSLPGGNRQTTSLAALDLNGDSWPDIVQGNYNQQNRFYLNDGTGSFSAAPTSVSADVQNTLAVDAVEVNGTFKFAPLLLTTAVKKPGLGRLAPAPDRSGGAAANRHASGFAPKNTQPKPPAPVPLPPDQRGKPRPIPTHGPIPGVQRYPALQVGNRIIKPRFVERQATYDGMKFGGDRIWPEKGALRFLRTAAKPMGIMQGKENLKTVHVKRGPGTAHVAFQALHKGRPIHGSLLSVHQGTDGMIHTLHARYFANTRVAPGHEGLPTHNAQTALDKANEAKGVKLPGRLTQNELVWYPSKDGALLSAWKLSHSTFDPPGLWVSYVDAFNGDLLKSDSQVKHVDGTGMVFEPNPVQRNGSTAGLTDGNDANSTILSSLRQNVPLLSLDGSGFLNGPYVIMNGAASATPNPAGFPGTIPAGSWNHALSNAVPPVYNYGRADKAFEEVSIYYAIDSVQRYIQSLGFPNFCNRPIDICAHAFQGFNAYATSGFQMHFGDGANPGGGAGTNSGVDLSEDMDVVVHEYGHSCIFDVQPGWGMTDVKGVHEGGAIHEGFGDYLALSYYGEKGNATYLSNAGQKAALGEWSMLNPAGLRNGENTKNYNTDWDTNSGPGGTPEVHMNGEIWMGALWDLRKLLVAKHGLPQGAQICDKLVFEALMGAPSPNCTFSLMVQEIYKADQVLNNGDNLTEIAQVFMGRGISQSSDFPALPVFPDLVFGNSGQINMGYQNNIGTFAAGVQLGAATDATYDVKLVDVTGDNYPDLMVGNSGTLNYLYVNAGNGTFPVSGRLNIDADTHATRVLAVGDINGDGRSDLVAGNYGQVNRWYANDGTADPFKAGSGKDVRVGDTENTTSLELTDVNGDGRLDIVTGSNGQGVRVRLNDGTGNFATPVLVPGAGASSQVVHVADVVGDSRRVLFANGAMGDFELMLENTNGQSRDAKLNFYLGGAVITAPTLATTSHLNWVRTQWYHVVVRRLDNALTLWRDGQQVASASSTALISALPNEQPLMFGKRSTFPAYPMHGRLDDIKFFSRALSDAEIKQIFADGWELPTTSVSDLDSGLIYYYPILETDAPQMVVDTIGNATGTAQNGATTADGRFGVDDINGAYLVDGSQNVGPGRYQFLNLTRWKDTNPTPQPFSFGTGSYTVSMWVQNVSVSGGSNATFIGNWKPAGTTDNTWAFGVDSNGKLFLRQGGNETVSDLNNDLTLNDSTWHLVMATRDATGKVDLYVDGQRVGGATGLSTDLNSTDVVWVGQMETSRLKASVDDIRVYNRSFQDFEALALFNKQQPSIVGTARVEIFLSPDELDTGEIVQLQLYSDFSSDTPFYDETFTGTGAAFTVTGNSSTTVVSPGRIEVQFDASKHQFAWQDLQGIIRLTPNPGAVYKAPTKVTVDSYRVTVNGQQFVYQTEFTPVRSAATNPLAQNIMMNRDSTHLMVVKLSQAISNYSFAHEMGHLMGAGHAQGDSLNPNDIANNPPLTVNNSMVAFSPYGNNTVSGAGGGAFVEGPGPMVRDEYLAMGSHFIAGHFNNGTINTHRFCTIMAYRDLINDSGQLVHATPNTPFYTRIPRFSSPGVYWQGKSTGHAPGLTLPLAMQRANEPLHYDNVRAMNTVGKIVSFYRDDNGSGRAGSGWDEPLRVPVPDRSRSPILAGTGRGGGVGDQRASGNGGQRQNGNSRGSGGQTLGGRGGGRTVSTGPNRKPGGGVQNGGSSRPGVGTGTRPVNRPGGGIGIRLPGQNNPSPVPAGGRPSNDDSAGSLLVQIKARPDQSLAGSTLGHNRGATRGSGEVDTIRTNDNRQAYHGRSVWWHMVVPADGVYEVRGGTAGSGIDTTLTVILPNGGPRVANDNDRRRPGPASYVSIPGVTLKAGQRIQFLVDGVNGAEGQVKINVSLHRGTAASSGN